MKHRHKNDQCLNCKSDLVNDENYCPYCGQENTSHRLPFKHIIIELIESFFHIDNKTLRTFQALLVKPGLLTSEFIKGKRLRFVPPVRLYVVISFAFFLILSFQKDESAEGKDNKNMKVFSFSNGTVEEEKEKDALLDSLIKTDEIKNSEFNKQLIAKAGKIDKNHEKFEHMIYRNVSYMMFVLMPLFALILLVFFRKNKLYYVDHLVYSIHFHCFLFLAISIYILLDLVINSSYLLAVLMPAIFVYLLLSMHNLYGGSIVKNSVKAIMISFLHISILVMLLVVTIIVSALLV